VLGLIADDLTGAGDASVQFARRGWHTFLSLEGQEASSPAEAGHYISIKAGHDGVIAITTDCRALTDEAAARLTCAALSRLMASGIDRVFLKIDSTLRGSVSGQIAGALSAWRTRHSQASALVCPAYPLMGRTVENHQLLVHGQPVDRTAFARDPITPVTSSDVRSLIHGVPDVIVADAVTDDDLMRLAGTIAADTSTMAVGSGGLAAALAAQLSPSEGEGTATRVPRLGTGARVLMLVTSLNPVSHVQTERLAAAWSDMTIVCAPTERVVDVSVADELARTFADHALRERWDVFGLVGGDGARSALRAIAASGIRILDSVVEGVPVGLVVGGPCDGTPVFTKAGGFGDEEALVRAVRALRS
jgi:uncharacterized protein YgbK (DUF1537 family)